MVYRRCVVLLALLLLLFLVAVVAVVTLYRKEIFITHKEGLSAEECLVNGLYPDATNCNRFYMCAAFGPVLFQCPSGLEFNPALNYCDWPDKSRCDLPATSSAQPPSSINLITEPQTHPQPTSSPELEPENRTGSYDNTVTSVTEPQEPQSTLTPELLDRNDIDTETGIASDGNEVINDTNTELPSTDNQILSETPTSTNKDTTLTTAIQISNGTEEQSTVIINITDDSQLKETTNVDLNDSVSANSTLNANGTANANNATETVVTSDENEVINVTNTELPSTDSQIFSETPASTNKDTTLTTATQISNATDEQSTIIINITDDSLLKETTNVDITYSVSANSTPNTNGTSNANIATETGVVSDGNEVVNDTNTELPSTDNQIFSETPASTNKDITLTTATQISNATDEQSTIIINIADDSQLKETTNVDITYSVSANSTPNTNATSNANISTETELASNGIEVINDTNTELPSTDNQILSETPTSTNKDTTLTTATQISNGTEEQSTIIINTTDDSQLKETTNVDITYSVSANSTSDTNATSNANNVTETGVVFDGNEVINNTNTELPSTTATQISNGTEEQSTVIINITDDSQQKETTNVDLTYSVSANSTLNTNGTSNANSATETGVTSDGIEVINDTNTELPSTDNQLLSETPTSTNKDSTLPTATQISNGTEEQSTIIINITDDSQLKETTNVNLTYSVSANSTPDTNATSNANNATETGVVSDGNEVVNDTNTELPSTDNQILSETPASTNKDTPLTTATQISNGTEEQSTIIINITDDSQLKETTNVDLTDSVSANSTPDTNATSNANNATETGVVSDGNEVVNDTNTELPSTDNQILSETPTSTNKDTTLTTATQISNGTEEQSTVIINITDDSQLKETTNIDITYSVPANSTPNTNGASNANNATETGVAPDENEVIDVSVTDGQLYVDNSNSTITHNTSKLTTNAKEQTAVTNFENPSTVSSTEANTDDIITETEVDTVTLPQSSLSENTFTSTSTTNDVNENNKISSTITDLDVSTTILPTRLDELLSTTEVNLIPLSTDVTNPTIIEETKSTFSGNQKYSEPSTPEVVTQYVSSTSPLFDITEEKSTDANGIIITQEQIDGDKIQIISNASEGSQLAETSQLEVSLSTISNEEFTVEEPVITTSSGIYETVATEVLSGSDASTKLPSSISIASSNEYAPETSSIVNLDISAIDVTSEINIVTAANDDVRKNVTSTVEEINLSTVLNKTETTYKDIVTTPRIESEENRNTTQISTSTAFNDLPSQFSETDYQVTVLPGDLQISTSAELSTVTELVSSETLNNLKTSTDTANTIGPLETSVTDSQSSLSLVTSVVENQNISLPNTDNPSLSNKTSPENEVQNLVTSAIPQNISTVSTISPGDVTISINISEANTDTSSPTKQTASVLPNGQSASTLTQLSTELAATGSTTDVNSVSTTTAASTKLLLDESLSENSVTHEKSPIPTSSAVPEDYTTVTALAELLTENGNIENALETQTDITDLSQGITANTATVSTTKYTESPSSGVVSDVTSLTGQEISPITSIVIPGESITVVPTSLPVISDQFTTIEQEGDKIFLEVNVTSQQQLIDNSTLTTDVNLPTNITTATDLNIISSGNISNEQSQIEKEVQSSTAQSLDVENLLNTTDNVISTTIKTTYDNTEEHITEQNIPTKITVTEKTSTELTELETKDAVDVNYTNSEKTITEIPTGTITETEILYSETAEQLTKTTSKPTSTLLPNEINEIVVPSTNLPNELNTSTIEDNKTQTDGDIIPSTVNVNLQSTTVPLTTKTSIVDVESSSPSSDTSKTDIGNSDILTLPPTKIEIITSSESQKPTKPFEDNDSVDDLNNVNTELNSDLETDTVNTIDHDDHDDDASNDENYDADDNDNDETDDNDGHVGEDDKDDNNNTSFEGEYDLKPSQNPTEHFEDNDSIDDLNKENTELNNDLETVSISTINHNDHDDDASDGENDDADVNDNDDTDDNDDDDDDNDVDEDDNDEDESKETNIAVDPADTIENEDNDNSTEKLTDDSSVKTNLTVIASQEDSRENSEKDHRHHHHKHSKETPSEETNDDNERHDKRKNESSRDKNLSKDKLKNNYKHNRHSAEDSSKENHRNDKSQDHRRDRDSNKQHSAENDRNHHHNSHENDSKHRHSEEESSKKEGNSKEQDQHKQIHNHHHDHNSNEVSSREDKDNRNDRRNHKNNKDDSKERDRRNRHSKEASSSRHDRNNSKNDDKPKKDVKKSQSDDTNSKKYLKTLDFQTFYAGASKLRKTVNIF